MRIKSFIALGAGIATALAAVRVNRSYQHWKLEKTERLHTTSKLLETARGNIEYTLEGSGPVALLVHGSPGGYDQGRALAYFLNLSGYTVLAVSRPGYRRTPITSGRSPEAQADLYAATLDELELPAATVIALSGGGPSALEFARRHADRCEGLILLCALATRYTEEGTYAGLSSTQRFVKQAFDKLIVSDPFLYLIIQMFSQTPGGDHLSKMMDSLVQNPVSTVGYQNDMQQFKALPEYPELNIQLPTLIIHGTADKDVPYAQAEYVAAKVPGAELISVVGANHFSTMADEKARAKVLTFLQQTTPALGSD